jgi:hypothetical protein
VCVHVCMRVYRRSPSHHHIYICCHPHDPARAAIRSGDKDSPCSLAVFFTSQHPSRARSEPRVDCAVQQLELSPPNKKTRPAILCNRPRPCRLNHPLPSPPAECETPAYTCRASTTPVSELPLHCILRAFLIYLDSSLQRAASPAGSRSEQH